VLVRETQGGRNGKQKGGVVPSKAMVTLPSAEDVISALTPAVFKVMMQLVIVKVAGCMKIPPP
jgi:hypothetical protein